MHSFQRRPRNRMALRDKLWSASIWEQQTLQSRCDVSLPLPHASAQLNSLHRRTVHPQVVTDEEPQIIECADGRTTPSVVSFQADGIVMVGRAAKRRVLLTPLASGMLRTALSVTDT